MDTSDSSNQTQFTVTIWETIAITGGALLLLMIGAAGLMYKFFSNAADPDRATMIAQSLIDYQIPGESQGVFGANLGGAKIAIVSSETFPKDPAELTADEIPNLSGVELFVARVPLDVETPPTEPTPLSNETQTAPTYDIFASPDFSFSYRSGEDFQVLTSRIEEKNFCGSMVPVRIQDGELLLSQQLPPVNAVKYDAVAVFDNSKRQVTVTAIGQNANELLTQVFPTLRCR